jgi:cytochrome c553
MSKNVKMLLVFIVISCIALFSWSTVRADDTFDELVLSCADCHGDDGMGDEDMPKIAGLLAADHVKLLNGYKDGTIPDEDGMMFDYVVDLSEDDILRLAKYYASLGE